MRRAGRRPGANTTRAALLQAARRHFAASGYDAASLRQIAADAGVDPAVVMHFFGSKEGLFREAVGWPFDPEPAAARLVMLDPTELGAGLGHFFLDTWEDPVLRDSLLALLRSAMTQPASANLLREFLEQQILGRLNNAVLGPDAELRVSLASAQMIGVAILRYILEIGPIASASTEELMKWLQPTLNNYFNPASAGDAENEPANGDHLPQ